MSPVPQVPAPDARVRPTAVTIARAVPEDLPALSRALQQVMPAAWMSLLGKRPGWQAFRLARDPHGDVLAVGGVDLVGREYVELRGIAVPTAHQGKGYGSVLVQHLVNEWRALRTLVCITTRPSFFARHGFVEADVASWVPPARRIRARSARRAMVHVGSSSRHARPLLLTAPRAARLSEGDS